MIVTLGWGARAGTSPARSGYVVYGRDLSPPRLARSSTVHAHVARVKYSQLLPAGQAPMPSLRYKEKGAAFVAQRRVLSAEPRRRAQEGKRGWSSQECFCTQSGTGG